MIVKRVLIIMLAMLWCISFIQIFSVPPYIGDIFGIYKSGYFKELERNMYIITDSFLHIKTMSKAEYAWIYLKDLQKRFGINIHVYDSMGNLIQAPGMSEIVNNRDVLNVINDIKPQPKFAVHGRMYNGVIPVYRKTECNFCHQPSRKPVLGVIEFAIPFDGYIYYTSERTILFIIITFAISVLLFVVIRWNPYKDINELFDK
ncbi:MAG: hypothetical protein N3F66_07115 [Spirochaetes bacterium]|nr:hypothetical protein [Spirochaetota bacterium]